MENSNRRPVSVWFGQIVMIVGAVLFLLGAGAVALVLREDTAVPAWRIILAVAMFLAMAGLCTAAFIGMARRKQWGRWLAVVVLSLVTIFGTRGYINQPYGPLNQFDYANSTEAAVGLMTATLILCLMLWVTLTLAFGKQVRSFFSRKQGEPTAQIVP